MKKIMSIICLCLFAATSLCAQDEQVRINNIKKSLDFIYATGTSMNSANEASSNAKELLSLEIEQWLKENNKGTHIGYVAKAVNNVSEIETKKGNLFRVFVYVKKDDILPYGDEDDILMVTIANDSVPKTMDTLPILTRNTETQPNNSPNKMSDQPSNTTFVPTLAEKEIQAIRHLSEINTFIAKGSKEGTIKAYGKYDSNTRLFSKTYFFLINKDGNVIAHLKKEGNNILNLESGKEDSIENHGRCGVIWFQFAE